MSYCWCTDETITSRTFYLEVATSQRTRLYLILDVAVTVDAILVRLLVRRVGSPNKVHVVSSGGL